MRPAGRLLPLQHSERKSRASVRVAQPRRGVADCGEDRKGGAFFLVSTLFSSTANRVSGNVEINRTRMMEFKKPQPAQIRFGVLESLHRRAMLQRSGWASLYLTGLTMTSGCML